MALAPDDAWVVVDGVSGWWRPAGSNYTWELDAGLHLVQFGHPGEAYATGAWVADVPAGGAAAWVAGLGLAGGSAAWSCEGDPADFVAQLAAYGAQDTAIAAARMGPAAMACSRASEAVRLQFEVAQADVWMKNGVGDGVFVGGGQWTAGRRGALRAARAWSFPTIVGSVGGIGALVYSALRDGEVPLLLPFVGYGALGAAVAQRQSLRHAGVIVPLTGLAIGGVGIAAGFAHPVGAVVVPIGALLQVGLNEAGLARAHRIRRAAARDAGP